MFFFLFWLKKTHVILFFWHANIIFFFWQCSQENVPSFCLGCKETKHVVSMLAGRETWFLFWIQGNQACCFQCSQESRLDFCFGYKKSQSRHDVFNARKKTNHFFLFWMQKIQASCFRCSQENEVDFCFWYKKSRHVPFTFTSSSGFGRTTICSSGISWPATSNSSSAGMSTLSSSSCLTGKLVANASTGVRQRTRGSFSEPVMNAMTCRLPSCGGTQCQAVPNLQATRKVQWRTTSYHFPTSHHAFHQSCSVKPAWQIGSHQWGLGGDLQSACQCHILLNLFPSQLSHWPHCLLKRHVKDTCCQGELSNGSKCDMPCGEVTCTPCCGRNQRRKEQKHALWKKCANPIPNSKKLGTRKRARTRKNYSSRSAAELLQFFSWHVLWNQRDWCTSIAVWIDLFLPILTGRFLECKAGRIECSQCVWMKTERIFWVWWPLNISLPFFRMIFLIAIKRDF